jgi:hypothetical protein
MLTSQHTEQPATIAYQSPSQSELVMEGMQVVGTFLLFMVLREIRMIVKECKS